MIKRYKILFSLALALVPRRCPLAMVCNYTRR
jgi:hypothetical protein